MIRAHVYFSGTVQGVGFRYTVRNFAVELGGLTGWVKNLPDGRVELEAEGPKINVQTLLEKIRNRFDGYIRDEIVDFLPPQNLYQTFEIVH